MKPGEDKDKTGPKKGIIKDPAEEQQLDKKDKPIKQPVPLEDDKEEDEDTLDNGLDDSEFDEFDENGGDDDFRDQVAKEETKKNDQDNKRDPDKKENMEAEEEERLKGIEGTDHHITNAEEEIVNKKGQ